MGGICRPFVRNNANLLMFQHQHLRASKQDLSVSTNQNPKQPLHRAALLHDILRSLHRSAERGELGPAERGKWDRRA